MNVVSLKPKSPLPEDLPGILRALADRIERGEVETFVCGYTADNRFEFVYPSSLTHSLELATIMQARCIERYRA